MAAFSWPQVGGKIPIFRGALKQKDMRSLEGELHFLLKVFPKVLLSDLAVSPLKLNIISYIVEGLETLPQAKTSVDEELANDVIPNVLALADYSPIIWAFATRANKLGESIQNVVDSLIESWRKASGIFLDENRLVDSTKALWLCLEQDGKEAMIGFFIDILNSYSHRPGFPQFELAREKVNDTASRHLVSKIIEDQIRSEYDKLIKSEFDSDIEDHQAWAWKVVVGSFLKARGRIDEINQIIERVQQELFAQIAHPAQSDG